MSARNGFAGGPVRWRALLAVIAMAASMLATGLVQASDDPTVGSCEEGGDAGGTQGSATQVGTPTACTGALFDATDVDVYRFHVAERDTIAVAVLPTGAAFPAVTVEHTSGTKCHTVIVGSCRRLDAPAGDWFVTVSNVGGGYLLSIVVGPPNPVSCEPNGDAGDASNPRPVTPPVACGGQLESATDSDAFEVAVPAGGSLAVAMRSFSLTPLALSVTGPGGATADCIENSTAGSLCRASNAAGGAWVISVSYAFAATPTEYGLTIAVGPPSPAGECENTVQDASNDTAAGATAMSPPTVCLGSIGTKADVDHYSFNVAAGSAIVVSMRPAAAPLSVFRLDLFSAGGASGTCFPGNNVDVCQRLNAPGGQWFVSIRHDARAAGSYVLEVAVNPSCEPTGDAGDTQAGAEPITPPAACTGMHGSAADVDYYSFEVTNANATIVAAARSTTGPVSKVDVELEGPAGASTIVCDPLDGGTVCRAVNAPAGTWYAKVTHASGSPGGYTLGVAIQE